MWHNWQGWHASGAQAAAPALYDYPPYTTRDVRFVGRPETATFYRDDPAANLHQSHLSPFQTIHFPDESPRRDVPHHASPTYTIPPSYAPPPSEAAPPNRIPSHAAFEAVHGFVNPDGTHRTYPLPRQTRTQAPSPETTAAGTAPSAGSWQMPSRAEQTNAPRPPYSRQAVAASGPAYGAESAPPLTVPPIWIAPTHQATDAPAEPPALTQPTQTVPATSAGTAQLPPRVTKATTSLNIYTRDMLPNSYTGSERAPLPDTQWVGHDKEKMNVMMPVDLYECFVILLSAPRLREIKFWRVVPDDNSRNWHKIKVKRLESLVIRDAETSIDILLDCIMTKRLRRLTVFYAAGCGAKFTTDKVAYRRLFASARAYQDDMVLRSLIIRPNHPAYSHRTSSLQAELRALECGGNWTFCVTDNDDI